MLALKLKGFVVPLNSIAATQRRNCNIFVHPVCVNEGYFTVHKVESAAFQNHVKAELNITSFMEVGLLWAGFIRPLHITASKDWTSPNKSGQQQTFSFMASEINNAAAILLCESIQSFW